MARSRTCPGPALLFLLDGARITATATQGGPVMYQPDHFRVDDLPPMHALMRGRPFAALVSAGAARLYATPLPPRVQNEGRGPVCGAGVGGRRRPLCDASADRAET